MDEKRDSGGMNERNEDILRENHKRNSENKEGTKKTSITGRRRRGVQR